MAMLKAEDAIKNRYRKKTPEERRVSISRWLAKRERRTSRVQTDTTIDTVKEEAMVRCHSENDTFSSLTSPLGNVFFSPTELASSLDSFLSPSLACTTANSVEEAEKGERRAATLCAPVDSNDEVKQESFTALLDEELCPQMLLGTMYENVAPSTENVAARMAADLEEEERRLQAQMAELQAKKHQMQQNVLLAQQQQAQAQLLAEQQQQKYVQEQAWPQALQAKGTPTSAPGMVSFECSRCNTVQACCFPTHGTMRLRCACGALKLVHVVENPDCDSSAASSEISNNTMQDRAAQRCRQVC